MRRRWIHFIAVLLFFVGGSQAMGAVGQPLARIVQVQRAPSEGRPSAAPPLTMPKFLDETPAVRGDTFQVTWTPSAGPLPTGIEVRFEYTQRRVRGIKALSLTYPFVVRQQRTATFTIAEDAYRIGGTVTTWRAQVLRDGTVLAEKTSPRWGNSP